jgi:predicted nucleotidyltransferase
VDFRYPVESVIPGAQGKVLAALLGTTGELNLRTVARLAGVSIAQASRVLPDLVELGMIERREVPPSSLFRIVPEHVATQALLILASARRNVMAEMGRLAGALNPAPESVIVFGSFARGDDDTESDIDVVVVRPVDIDADDHAWLNSIEKWKADVEQLAGSTIEIIDIDAGEIAIKLTGKAQLWLDVRREGQVLFGRRLDQLVAPLYA